MVAWAAWRIRGAPAVVVRPMWDCGLDAPTPRMEYTATGYAQPVEFLFKDLYRPTEHAENSAAIRPPWVVLARMRRYRVEIVEPIRSWVYPPVASGIFAVSRRVSRFQSGRIHAYLAYAFITLLGFLLLIRAVGGPSP